MIPGWTDDALLHEILVPPRTPTVRPADLRLVERPGWSQVITPSFAAGGFNEIAFAALADDDADRAIDAAIAEYRAHGIAFRFGVPPGSAPADLAARLERRGLERSEVVGVARPTTPLVVPPAADVVVRDVGPEDVDVFSEVMAVGWSTPVAPLLGIHRDALADGRTPMFLARLDGRPVGAAAYVAYPRSAYLLGAVVVPEARRRGAYRELVRARLDDARARGLALATSQARANTSAPILAALGFVEVARWPSFRGVPG